MWIVRFNAGEMPLCSNVNEEANGLHLEEERRLCYVGMTRAKHSLFLCYVSTLQRQLVQPSPFLREIPRELLLHSAVNTASGATRTGGVGGHEGEGEQWGEEGEGEALAADSGFFSCGFLARFDVAIRGSVSHLFHKWGKTSLFKEPAALVSKVKAVVHEHLALKSVKNKGVLRQLLPMLQARVPSSFHTRSLRACAHMSLNPTSS